MEQRPRAIPTLDQLAANPGLAADLPYSALQCLLTGAHVVQAALLGRLLVLQADCRTGMSDNGATQDGAVGIEEAARTLGMKVSTLYKKWRALNIGYPDADGHVKFTRSALQRYLLRRGG